MKSLGIANSPVSAWVRVLRFPRSVRKPTVPAPGLAAGAGTIGFLTERGNLKSLSQADTGLFAIPKDFTKTP